MKKPMIIGSVIAALGIAGGVAVASYSSMTQPPDSAEVVKVTPAFETVETPRQVCEQVSVTHRRPSSDEHNLVGTAVGALVGGVVGNQFGGGSGKKLMTAAGAVGGGYAGNQLQDRMNQNDTYTTTENRCHTVTDTEQRQVGYDVRYRYEGQEHTLRMAEDPGQRIAMSNGQPVLAAQ